MVSGKLVPHIGAAILILAGCAPQIRKRMEVCPGKGSVAEALAALQSQSQRVVPLRANGQCRLEYYVEGKKKPQRENFDVRLWVNPPVEIYLQGDKALVPKAIVLGSNEREFWLSIRPKEISTHWWGRWSERDFSQGLIINPRTLLEALGMGQVDAERDWSLSNEGPFDILAERSQGVTIKKIYVYCCEYQVRRIEFFDSSGRLLADAELERYEEVSEGFLVPALIKVTTHTRDPEDSLSITLSLKTMKPAEINEQQRNYLFEHRPPKGFRHVLEYRDGMWIEQQ